MKNGFIKVASALPTTVVADPSANLKEHLKIFENANSNGVKLLVFPELSLSGYTCGDLFFSDVLLRNTRTALLEYCDLTSHSDTISIIGLPLVVNNKIYNSAAICQKGQILGIVPKKIISKIADEPEIRYFSAYNQENTKLWLGNNFVPFGNKQIFSCKELEGFSFGVEIGSELFAPIPPSASLAENGALIIASPHSSVQYVGTEERRRLFVKSQSERLSCGYILSGSGEGESTTDLVMGGHSIIAENGTILSENNYFEKSQNSLLISEIDLELLSHERKQSDLISVTDYEKIYFSIDLKETYLTRIYPQNPFVPSNEELKLKRCKEILNIQAKGLCNRLIKARAEKCIIGISGGLDSCLAILVAAEACDILGRPRTDIIGVTMPCFGTTARTKSNAELLVNELGAELKVVNIREAVSVHFKDIGHDEANRNVVYENAQARERTQVLMDIANMENGLVLGTGDLSELALGWATYNGDHMSMYAVNAGVPKTLIRHITAYYADISEAANKKELAKVLRDILDTPVSPELLPADDNGNIAQKTEDIVGPYEIHDFYIYYLLRYGFSPEKLFRLAKNALGDKFSDEILLKWLKNLIRRFFTQQFKRSCLPDAPKIGSVGVSPRGALHMPSDASFDEWLKESNELIK